MDGSVSADKFWEFARVTLVGDCWIWGRAVSSSGYGSVMFAGRQRLAHGVAYELANGPVPDGLELDHICRHRLCINPHHLEAVTHLENMRRRGNPYEGRDRKAACRRGHPYTPENTWTAPTGVKHCRACARLRDTALRRKKGIKPRNNVSR